MPDTPRMTRATLATIIRTKVLRHRREPSVDDLARALAVVFAYNASNASVAPDGSLEFGGGPTSYWRDRAWAVKEALRD